MVREPTAESTKGMQHRRRQMKDFPVLSHEKGLYKEMTMYRIFLPFLAIDMFALPLPRLQSATHKFSSLRGDAEGLYFLTFLVTMSLNPSLGARKSAVALESDDEEDEESTTQSNPDWKVEDNTATHMLRVTLKYDRPPRKAVVHSPECPWWIDRRFHTS